MSYQPKTGAPCACRPGIARDNCPACEGTGWRIDFAAIRARRGTLCGTRRSYEEKPGDWRVVCATCGAGGSVRHNTRELAGAAAVRDSNKPCRACGAN